MQDLSTTAPATLPATTQSGTRPFTEVATPLESVAGYLEKLGVDRTINETDWWAWLFLLVAIFLGLTVGKLASSVFRWLADRAEKRRWMIRAVILRSLAGPLNLTIFTIGLAIGLSFIELEPGVRGFTLKVIQLLFIIGQGWLLYNLVDVLTHFIGRLTRGHRNSQLQQMIGPLIRKTVRIFLVVVFTLFIAKNVFNQDVAAFLTGLGIAGLAVSLAAQDSIKNLFGSITILLDRPFNVGDRIVFDNVDGSVEEIGFRSTRVRQMDGALANVPNAKLIDSSVINVNRRKSIRRLMNVTITYDTAIEKVDEAVQIIRKILTSPEMSKPFDMTEFPPRVFFNEFNADSLNIIVLYWHFPPDWWTYMEYSQKVNMLIFEQFNEAGIEFAFPTQTLYLAGDPKRKLAMQMLGSDLKDQQRQRGSENPGD